MNIGFTLLCHCGWSMSVPESIPVPWVRPVEVSAIRYLTNATCLYLIRTDSCDSESQKEWSFLYALAEHQVGSHGCGYRN